MERRRATPQEVKALAHPLRLRILRACLDDSLTNVELARRLDRDPGTVLYHVRKLVATGFLAPDEVRAGRRGALERPYRSTGKSWTLDVGESTQPTIAMVEALRAEMLEGGPESIIAGTRLAARLTPERIKHLRAELGDMFDRIAAEDDPGGEPVGLFFAMHTRPRPDPG